MSRERVLHFVRHGQYVNDPDLFGGRLTPLGRRQARRTGSRLARWPIVAVHVSDLNRALETAELIGRELPADLALKRSRVLREMLPTRIPNWKVPLAKRAEGRANLDRILARYFRPARGERHEVVVCHGNLIRALVSRALDARLTAWTRMRVHHGGITRFVIRGDGGVRLDSFNDTGHLPLSMLTGG